MSTNTLKLDGAQLAVLNSRFEGVAGKMANTLFRTGRSGVLNRARDFSCCIVTAAGDLLTVSESLPIHVLAGPDMMSRSMVEFHPKLKRGEAYINNSPYHGCSHAADQTILVPVVDNNGQHRFTVLAKAHQADIGNSVPTTYFGEAKDVYEEGALIFPSVQIQRDYRDIEDITRMCMLRIRVPEQWYGDYLAALGAARIGEKEILSLAEEVGWEVLEKFAGQWLDYSEQCMVDTLAELPEGEVSKITSHDPFPGTPSEGIPIKVRVKVDPDQSKVVVDLTDNMDCLPCGLNLSEACARTSAMIGIFNSIDHNIPKNSGSFRRIEVMLRQGCIVGIPDHPFSCSVATTNIADRVANGVQTALAELGEGVGMAEAGAVIAPNAGVVSGVDHRTNKAYVNQIFLGFTAGAAGPNEDCWLTTGHVGNAGLCHQDSIELDELYQPLHVYRRHILKDTEGAGKYRGAPAFYCEFGPSGIEFEIGYVSDGNINRPLGVRGGLPGGASDQYLLKKDGSREQLPPCAQVVVQSGDRIVAIGTGGGGYGNPKHRSTERVLKDYRDGVITTERAENVYGVVINEGGSVDQKATDELRLGVEPI